MIFVYKEKIKHFCVDGNDSFLLNLFNKEKNVKTFLNIIGI